MYSETQHCDRQGKSVSATNCLAVKCLNHISLFLWKAREREPPHYIQQLTRYSILCPRQWDTYLPVTTLLDYNP